ncbi:MAG: VWA domain-containing protein [Methanomicrobiales archaeon]|nr:VWA domain-containing protein [Methanomicrobiales archaeon]
MSVRTSTQIAVLVRDTYGNPVDNRSVVENVKFDASAQGLSGFLSGGSFVKSLTVPVNESGYAAVQYLVDPVGLNYIFITPPAPISQRLISIEGVSNGIPFSVSSDVSPGGSPYPYTTINDGQFTIVFTFLDQYGYPSMNQPVNISTNVAGEAVTLITNQYGMVVLTYGPKDLAGLYTITAAAVNNLSVFTSQTVEFINGAPVDALLTASPQTMASRDVFNDITSTLIMRVLDVKGNPVQGETVNFRLKSNSYGTFNQTMPPVLKNGVTSTSSLDVDIPAVTDANGEATVTFQPGAFTSDVKAPGYSQGADGNSTVEARWTTVVRQVTLRYVNYPYLTVETEVNPKTLKVNESVDLTVRLKGDGYALKPTPIDVVIVTDRSGSMVWELPDRAVNVMNAAKIFASKFDFSRDRLGQVTFGGKGVARVENFANSGKAGIDSTSTDDKNYANTYYKGNGTNYADYANLDLPLSSNFAAITSAIERVVPLGNTPMRYGIYKAINELVANGSQNSVKAIVVLTDGDYNDYGDPLARGSTGSSDPTNYNTLTTKYYPFTDITTQNMAEYASAKNVRIYTIAYGSGLSTGGIETLQLLASGANGTYKPAPNQAALTDFYIEIAGALCEVAGVNTTMNLSFENVAVNNVTVSGNQVFKYQRITGRSTRVNSWNNTPAGQPSLPGYPQEYDSTNQWNANRSLDFNVGTIRLNQTWEVTMTFEVLKEGNINVLDPNSKITIENSPTPLRIPEVFITALPNTSEVSYASAQLHIQNLVRTNEGSRSSADLKWDLVYDGIYPISETVMIAPFGTEDWTRLPARQVPSTATSDTGTVPLSGLAAGQYTIRVEVNAADANSDQATLDLVVSDVAKRPQIRIT